MFLLQVCSQQQKCVVQSPSLMTNGSDPFRLTKREEKQKGGIDYLRAKHIYILYLLNKE